MNVVQYRALFIFLLFLNSSLMVLTRKKDHLHPPPLPRIQRCFFSCLLHLCLTLCLSQNIVTFIWIHKNGCSLLLKKNRIDDLINNIHITHYTERRDCINSLLEPPLSPLYIYILISIVMFKLLSLLFLLLHHIFKLFPSHTQSLSLALYFLLSDYIFINVSIHRVRGLISIYFHLKLVWTANCLSM